MPKVREKKRMFSVRLRENTIKNIKLVAKIRIWTEANVIDESMIYYLAKLEEMAIERGDI